MIQPQKSNGGLTAAQQARKEIWSQALTAAGIPPETMDWRQPEIGRPLYA